MSSAFHWAPFILKENVNLQCHTLLVLQPINVDDKIQHSYGALLFNLGYAQVLHEDKVKHMQNYVCKTAHFSYICISVHR